VHAFWKKFIAYEQVNGVSQEEYFTAGEGHELHNYRQEYNDLAVKLVDMAHAENYFVPALIPGLVWSFINVAKRLYFSCITILTERLWRRFRLWL